MKILHLSLLFVIIVQLGSAQTGSIDYFGQTPPGDTAVPFAPSIISKSNRMEFRIVFNPDGNECYFTVVVGQDPKIYYTKRENNTWTKQEVAPFSVNRITSFPFLSADGNRLYFDQYFTDWMKSDIWYVERKAGGWSDPQLLPSPINSDFGDGGFTQTTDSIVYLYSDRSGDEDIWCKRPLFDQADNLRTSLNFTYDFAHPCIAQDGSYLIFVSYGSSRSFQQLYVSFNKGDNRWTTPVNMEISSAKINIANHSQVSPSLSPDGKFLFFSRHNTTGEPFDIYWVSTHILDTLKKVAFAPKLSKQIPILTIKQDSAVNYIIPANTFSCEYGTDSLKYSVTLSDGSGLPTWLRFNDTTKTLTGIPLHVETISLKVAVTNKDTMSASCTFSVIVTPVTGIDLNEKHNIQVFPNPSTGMFTLFFGTIPVKEAEVEITNLEGRLVFSDIYKNTAIASIDLLGYPAGMYVVKVIADGKYFNEKITLK